VRLEIFCTTNVRLAYAVAESSIVAPADSPFSLSVGAVGVDHWPSGPQEPYSSRGPTNKSRLNPLSLTKPDLVGPDRVDTWTYSSEGFPGTSASAPHVAGAAAVVWSAHPDWNAEQVRVWLEYAALDLGEAGKDNVYGAGLLRLPPPAVPSPGKSHTYGARAGWYLVSVPTLGEQAGIFGVPLYFWNGRTYETLSGSATLDPLRGYWAKLPASKTVSARGNVPKEDQIAVLGRAGWHMISVPWPYPKEGIRVLRGGEERSWTGAVASGWLAETIWGFDGTYRSASALEPWYGYWVRALVDGLSLKFVYAERATGLSPKSPEGSTVAPPADLPMPPTLESALRFLCVPNPVREAAVVFKALGPQNAEEIRVQVFDLAGRQVWKGAGLGGELSWPLEDLTGKPVANGVYLYLVQARVLGEWIQSGLQKLVVAR